MIKKKLALFITLSLFLSGCGFVNQNKDNTNATVSENQKTSSENANEKPLEKPKSSQKSESNSQPDSKSNSEIASTPKSDTPKSFTPKIVSDNSSLSTKSIEWSWLYSAKESATLLSKYNAYGFGDTSKKIIYLTFDEGYENGYTSSILDTLKANNVQASFFVTKPYVTGNFNGIPTSELLKKMSREGHIIANHSVQHKSMPTFTNETAFNAELKGVEDAVNNIPGCKMSKYFRPPEGTFSELSLYYTQKLNYKTIFFTLAYKDYDVDNQPDPESSKATLLKNSRNGMICLLHAVSKTNATILDSLIKEWKNQGYEFKTLDELPN